MSFLDRVRVFMARRKTVSAGKDPSATYVAPFKAQRKTVVGGKKGEALTDIPATKAVRGR